ncbi:MAG: hypothetical protein ACRDVW_04600, partial [Acidimicrobiales bacterium]
MTEKRLTRLAWRAGVSGLVVATMVLGSASLAAASNASARAQAKKHVLVLSDMPSGWHTEAGTGGASTSNGLPDASVLAGCLGVPAKLIEANPPEYDSPYFENKSGSLEVQDAVSVFPSLKEAHAQFAAIANAKTPACMTTYVNSASFKQQLLNASGEG